MRMVEELGIAVLEMDMERYVNGSRPGREEKSCYDLWKGVECFWGSRLYHVSC